MLTTLGEKVRAAFRREPIAFCLTAFLLLAGAGTGITARQILTAAPGSISVVATTASEGTSTALARADHVHSVTAPAVLLQPSLPGTIQSGGINVTGSINNNGAYYSSNQLAYFNYLSAVNSRTWQYFSEGGQLNPAHEWSVGSVTNQTANGALYRWKDAGGAALMELNYLGRFRVADGAIGGGIEAVNNQPLYLQKNGGFTGPTVIIDTSGVTTAGTNKLLDVRNNGATKFSVDGAGNVAFVGSLSGTMTKVGSGAVTLAAQSIPGSTCTYNATLLTVAGASTSDICGALYVTGMGATGVGSPACEVTAANTVSFRFCNMTTSAVSIPIAQSYIAYVMR